jgi:hypothetical protein
MDHAHTFRDAVTHFMDTELATLDADAEQLDDIAATLYDAAAQIDVRHNVPASVCALIRSAAWTAAEQGRSALAQSILTIWQSSRCANPPLVTLALELLADSLATN